MKNVVRPSLSGVATTLGRAADVLADITETLEDRTREWRNKPDMNVPRYDRRQVTGNWMVCWLTPDGVVFSDRTKDFGSAMKMTRTHKRMPTWIVHGLESALDTAKLCLAYRTTDWLTTRHLDQQLRGIVEVKATFNLPQPSTYIRPKKARG